MKGRVGLVRVSSFSGDTKNELARVMPDSKCCQVAELSALLRLNGKLELTENNRKTLYYY